MIDLGRPQQRGIGPHVLARFAQRGVAAANFGPGTPAQAHQEAEYAEIPQLEGCYERLVSFLGRN
jgi:succinyl-diaminopimelate desuccinylase